MIFDASDVNRQVEKYLRSRGELIDPNQELKRGTVTLMVDELTSGLKVPLTLEIKTAGRNGFTVSPLRNG
jgi:hypothetical protein